MELHRYSLSITVHNSFVQIYKWFSMAVIQFAYRSIIRIDFDIDIELHYTVILSYAPHTK